MDIKGIMLEATDNLMNSDEIKQLVIDTTVDTIRKEVKEALTSWDIRSIIQKKLKTEVSESVEGLDFSVYRSVMFE